MEKDDKELEENNEWYSKLPEDVKRIVLYKYHYTKGYQKYGTKMDELSSKQISLISRGMSFVDMDHDQLVTFFKANDIEKFEMAYWAQREHSRKKSIGGIIIGILISFVSIYQYNQGQFLEFLGILLLICLMYWCYRKFGWFSSDSNTDRFINKI